MNLYVSKSETPIYEQLYDQLVKQIVNGELKADECLPSIRTVARELGIGVITVKTAYERLERNGFIYTMQGKGCFVRENGKPEDKRNELAAARLREELRFYRQLGLTRGQLIALIERYYDEEDGR